MRGREEGKGEPALKDKATHQRGDGTTKTHREKRE